MSATRSEGKKVDCIISKLKILFQEVVDSIISQINKFPQEIVDSIISKVKIFLQEIVDLDDESNTPAEVEKVRINKSLDGAGEANNLKKRSKSVLRYRNEDNTDPNDAEENSSLAENYTSQDNHNDKDIFPKTIFEEFPNEVAAFKVEMGKKKKKGKTYESDEFFDDGQSRRVSCTGCGRKVNPAYGTIFRHPMIHVLVCKKCFQYYNSGPFTRDEHGIEEQCRWCGDGGDLICCDKCEKVFCKTCLQRNCGKTYLKSLMNAPDDFKWLCIVCNKDKPQKHIQRLRKRCDFVMETLDELQEKTNSKKSKQLAVLIKPTTLERRNRLNCLSKGLGSTGEEFSLSCESPVKKTFSKQDLPVELFSKSESDEEKEMVSFKLTIDFSSDSDFETESLENTVLQNKNHIEESSESDENLFALIDNIDQVKTEERKHEYNLEELSNKLSNVSSDSKESKHRSTARTTMTKHTRKRLRPVTSSSESDEDLSAKSDSSCDNLAASRRR